MEECWLKNNCKQLHCNDENGCLIKFKLNYLYEQAGVAENLRATRKLVIDRDGTDMPEFQQLRQIQDTILDFVANGQQLYLHSAIAGNGKTSWALRLLQTYFNKIWLKTNLECKALFVHVPSLLLALKDNISEKNTYIQHVKKNITSCDLVIWDDIGTKNSTPFESENLLSMVDSRILMGKANIFTSNLNDAELQSALGDRLASRISHLGYNIELHGGDKRGISNE